mmetsp:Transcript_61378/g.170201  ORF Transcript_61378/g.170201 Transcript_61378/m.170201 type:complete len:238 (+) Transcript_61378:155-868(+)
MRTQATASSQTPGRTQAPSRRASARPGESTTTQEPSSNSRPASSQASNTSCFSAAPAACRCCGGGSTSCEACGAVIRPSPRPMAAAVAASPPKALERRSGSPRPQGGSASTHRAGNGAAVTAALRCGQAPGPCANAPGWGMCATHPQQLLTRSHSWPQKSAARAIMLTCGGAATKHVIPGAPDCSSMATGGGGGWATSSQSGSSCASVAASPAAPWPPAPSIVQPSDCKTEPVLPHL